MGERIYITPDDYDFAAANGISAINVRQRVETYNWPIERAISTPVRKASGNYGWEERKGTAQANGINYRAYYHRVKNGWDADRAASEPVKKNENSQLLWKRWKEIAIANKVTYRAFHTRVLKMGWNHEKAATTAPYDSARKVK